MDPYAKRLFIAISTLLGFGFTTQGLATDAIAGTIAVPMTKKETATYYVAVNLEGIGLVDFLVDTGSSHMVINEETLDALKKGGRATYIAQMAGVMADGTRKNVPLYSIAAIEIGNRCKVHDIEAAVFPGKTRNILGMSALRKAAPFVFTTTPPTLALSGCGVTDDLSPVAHANEKFSPL